MNVRAVVAAALVLAASACSSGDGTKGSDAIPNTQAQTTTSATHWWSTADYCGILRQTVHAGHSILAGTQAGDPELLSASTAFVTAVQKSAPPAVHTQWTVLGAALLSLIKSDGKVSTVHGVDPHQVAQAASAIAADAQRRCSLKLGSS